MIDAPVVLDLRDAAVLDPAISGAKGANVARAAVVGLPTAPGFVLTTAGVARRDEPEVDAALMDAWRRLGGPSVLLAVRSSSTIEDASQSSMAGQFTSVLDVQGEAAFRDAVQRVIDSASRAYGQAAAPQPMAVLVQRQIDAQAGGVLFSVHPVTGDRSRVVVEVVPSRPDELVGGSVTAAHYVLSRRGRVLERQRAEAAPALSRSVRRRLVDMARRAEDAFGSAQDIEWALDRSGALYLLQSRPITAIAERTAGGPVMGPGPVAETFPDPLRPLEVDVLVGPLRAGISRALLTTGAASRRQVEASPVVTTVGGWVAADLDLLGVNRSVVRKRLDPTILGRRLVSAWRVGRLRVGLPAMASSLIAAVDDDLLAVGSLAERDEHALLDLLERAMRELATVHTYEVLAGVLLGAGRGATPAPVVALAALCKGRAAGLDDDEIVAATPVVLALTAPSIVSESPLPPVPNGLAPDAGLDLSALDTRDALRLRARWLQELIVRIARMLGIRLAAAGRIEKPRLVAELHLDELAALVRTGVAPDDLAARAEVAPGPPLPTMFRLEESGAVRPVRRGGQDGKGATGIAAGGGRGSGTVVHHFRIDVDAERAVHGGVVLVTRHLEPQLAPLLPSLAGLVAETGSALSHLAILAREMHVPTVVGVDDARRRFPPGAEVVVDGDEGVVEIVRPRVAVSADERGREP